MQRSPKSYAGIRMMDKWANSEQTKSPHFFDMESMIDCGWLSLVNFSRYLKLEQVADLLSSETILARMLTSLFKLTQFDLSIGMLSPSVLPHPRLG